MIERLISQINETIMPWLKKGTDGLLRFTDPIDGEEISAHYGATHAAASWVIFGQRTQDRDLEECGIALLSSILDRWADSIKLPSYHFDFNNFALCVVHPYVQDTKLAQRVKETVLSTQDSDNPTTNWYPMRWYVNLCKYKWSGEEKYKVVCDECRRAIQEATYADGFIDDRTPKGKSFNLQYDVATVAVLQFLRVQGEEIDISAELGALLNTISPDGDINYLGRGVNQVFAWGLWIYLLKSAGREQVEGAIEYLENHLPQMLANHNIMLNKWPGEEKYLWWDYHYCSVYTAHLLFWLVLAVNDKAPVKPKYMQPRDSGIHVFTGDGYKVVTFEGRSEYLAEKGPVVALVWTKRDGVLVKGCFAPWQGAFGNQYTMADVSLRNYCGLLALKQNRDYSKNRYIHKLFPDLHTAEAETIQPLFVPVDVKEGNGKLELIWSVDFKKKFIVNVPMAADCQFKCFVDDKEVKLINTSKIRNQYSWVDLLQSKVISGSKVKICITV